uniref:Uncharacterized protein n=1 Tax=Arundo donax TaxID=35708 RepID=A0A0A9BR14_ARUDO
MRTLTSAGALYHTLWMLSKTSTHASHTEVLSLLFPLMIR